MQEGHLSHHLVAQTYDPSTWRLRQEIQSSKPAWATVTACLRKEQGRHGGKCWFCGLVVEGLPGIPGTIPSTAQTRISSAYLYFQVEAGGWVMNPR